MHADRFGCAAAHFEAHEPNAELSHMANSDWSRQV